MQKIGGFLASLQVWYMHPGRYVWTMDPGSNDFLADPVLRHAVLLPTQPPTCPRSCVVHVKSECVFRFAVDA
eukprot:365786-Chlamydomonas_euryale.AAC.3